MNAETTISTEVTETATAVAENATEQPATAPQATENATVKVGETTEPDSVTVSATYNPQFTFPAPYEWAYAWGFAPNIPGKLTGYPAGGLPPVDIGPVDFDENGKWKTHDGMGFTSGPGLMRWVIEQNICEGASTEEINPKECILRAEATMWSGPKPTEPGSTTPGGAAPAGTSSGATAASGEAVLARTGPSLLPLMLMGVLAVGLGAVLRLRKA